MNKKTVKLSIVVAMLLAVSLYFVGGTYARYATDFEGNAEVQVAKWSAKITGQEGAEESGEVTLKFTPVSNDYVAKDRIAPDVTAKATLELDLTGTEVAVDVKLAGQSGTLEEAVKQAAVTTLGITEGDVTFDATVSAADDAEATQVSGSLAEGYTVALPDGDGGKTALGATNGKVKIEMTITWTDNSNNETDTAAGKKGTNLTIPVKLTVQQHIDE